MTINRKNIINFLKKAYNFGLLLPLTNIVILYGQKFLSNKLCLFISNWRHQQIRDKLSNILLEKSSINYCNDHQRKSFSVSNNNNTIWTCWLQGEEAMPEILKLCLHSIRIFANNHPVCLLTQNNYTNYVTIPEHVVEKFKNGIISPTHFSDVLRISLINQRGGAWIDVTLLLTENISESFFSNPFYSIKNKPYSFYVSQCRWTGFCLGGTQNNPITSKVQNWLYHFWEKNDTIIDYFMLDYLLEKVYREDNKAKEIIDSIPFSNPHIGSLNRILERTCQKEEFIKMTEDTSIFKLSWKNHTQALYTNKDNLYYYIKQTFNL